MGSRRVLFAAVLACSLAACETPGVGRADLASVTVCPAGPTVQGVDVSAEVVDWKAFAAGGWDFAIAKASEGVTFVESQFATNWPQMKAAGIVRGAYCYFHPSPDDPVMEADFFVDTVNKAGGFAPGDIPALDLETLDGDTAAVVAADALAWLARVKADTGITPIIYTSPRVFDTLLGSPSGFDGYPLWDVTWNGGPPNNCPNIPASWSGWAFWQYAGDSITAPGLPGSANDGDVFNGTRADLINFGASLMAPVTDAGPMSGNGPDAFAAGPDAGFAAGPDAGAGYANNGDLTGGCDAADRSSAAPPLLLLLALGLVLHRPRSRRRTSA